MTHPEHHASRARRDDGAVTLFLAAIFIAAVVFAGLVYNAGHVLHANDDAFDLAGKAARVGVQQLDATSLRAGVIRVDAPNAISAATSYLHTHHVTGEITATGGTVTVTVVEHIAYRLLAPLHAGGATVTQTRAATATPGP